MEEKFREIWKKVPRDFGKSSERFLGKVQVLFLFRLNAIVSGGDNVFQSVTQCLHRQ